MYGYGTEMTVTLVYGDAQDAFANLVGYISMEDAVNLLREVGVDNDKLKGLVCAHALSEVGLD